MTTGATLVHCTQAILAAGARSVSVVTLARVERVSTVHRNVRSMKD